MCVFGEGGVRREKGRHDGQVVSRESASRAPEGRLPAWGVVIGRGSAVLCARVLDVWVRRLGHKRHNACVSCHVCACVSCHVCVCVSLVMCARVCLDKMLSCSLHQTAPFFQSTPMYRCLDFSLCLSVYVSVCISLSLSLFLSLSLSLSLSQSMSLSLPLSLSLSLSLPLSLFLSLSLSLSLSLFSVSVSAFVPVSVWLIFLWEGGQVSDRNAVIIRAEDDLSVIIICHVSCCVCIRERELMGECERE